MSPHNSLYNPTFIVQQVAPASITVFYDIRFIQKLQLFALFLSRRQRNCKINQAFHRRNREPKHSANLYSVYKRPLKYNHRNRKVPLKSLSSFSYISPKQLHPAEKPGAIVQLVEKVFFDKLLDCEKHTQTRKESPSAYKSTVGDS